MCNLGKNGVIFNRRNSLLQILMSNLEKYIFFNISGKLVLAEKRMKLNAKHKVRWVSKITCTHTHMCNCARTCEVEMKFIAPFVLKIVTSTTLCVMKSLAYSKILMISHSLNGSYGLKLAFTYSQLGSHLDSQFFYKKNVIEFDDFLSKLTPKNKR